ncbi:glycosyltransferase [Vibrio mediterranei]|uniref:glycosyltransferase n=1 Tax=Vibrio mediterranei TaxID=689 RepID=UPI0022836D6A|nr:glycosyltransferase [Vibrio mediterranei]MCY9851287.1 glycosyltransferase [Vibrio mediterranei]
MTKQCQKHIVVFDAYSTKDNDTLALHSLLRQLGNESVQISVLAAKASHWARLKDYEIPLQIYSLPFPIDSKKRLSITDWFKSFCQLCYCLYFLTSLPKVHLMLSFSQPQMALPVYWLRVCLGYALVHLVYSKLYDSATNLWCLTKATKVFYLAGTEELNRHLLQQSNTLKDENWQSFQSGITIADWPTVRKTADSRIFWAGDLNQDLIEHLLTAVAQVPRPIDGDICYYSQSLLKSADKSTSIPRPIKGLHWYQGWRNIDEIRQQCSIFVSTAPDESANLLILEAMAAGMCPVIPRDNGYWGRVLSDGYSCLKYNGNEPSSLAKVLHHCYKDPFSRDAIAVEAMKVAQCYDAEKSYRPITTYVLATCNSILELELSHD